MKYTNNTLPASALQFRSFDGSHNNVANPAWGAVGEHLLRRRPAAYGPGEGLAPRPGNPRKISNQVCAAKPPVPSSTGLSNMVWAWGQFLDHEVDLTPIGKQPVPIHVPEDDPETAFRGKEMEFERSVPAPGTGTGPHCPREQFNEISAFIDGSNVYGSDAARATALRRLDGSGKLRMANATGVEDPEGFFLPSTPVGVPNLRVGPLPPEAFFLAGDVRVNEHGVLTAMHTLFALEHNFVAQRLADDTGSVLPDAPEERDEWIYQRARKFVGACMQRITFEEFLPKLLGPDAIGAYGGYDSAVNPGVTNLFATACYRLGHSMLPANVPVISGGSTEELPLRDLFFNPGKVRELGFGAFLEGLPGTTMSEIDAVTVEEVRSFLFRGPSGGKLLDLAALNIQRGRDHGLPDFNTCRAAFGLAPYGSIEDISSDPDVRAGLLEAYNSVEDVDPWLGAVAEDHANEAQVGGLVQAVLADQFGRLRDGDRFWYQADPWFTTEPSRLLSVAQNTLAVIMRRHLATDASVIQDDVFQVTAPSA